MICIYWWTFTGLNPQIVMEIHDSDGPAYVGALLHGQFYAGRWL